MRKKYDFILLILRFSVNTTYIKKKITIKEGSVRRIRELSSRDEIRKRRIKNPIVATE